MSTRDLQIRVRVSKKEMRALRGKARKWKRNATVSEYVRWILFEEGPALVDEETGRRYPLSGPGDSMV